MNFKWVFKLKTGWIVSDTLKFILSELVRAKAYLSSENSHRGHKTCYYVSEKLQHEFK